MNPGRPKTATGKWNWSRFAGAHSTDSGDATSDDDGPLSHAKHPLVSAEEEQLPRKSSLVDHTKDQKQPSGEQSSPRKTVRIQQDPSSDEQQQLLSTGEEPAQTSSDNQAIESEPLQQSPIESRPESTRRNSRFLELTDDQQNIPRISLELITDPTKAAREPDHPELPPIVPVIKVQRPSREPSTDAPETSANDLCTCPSEGVPDTYVMDSNDPVSNQAHNDAIRAVEIAEEHDTNLVAVVPRPTDTEVDMSIKPVRIKKRKMALRKTRNAIARKPFLKAGLGRRLAIPTKEALRRQARGEDVTIADIKVVG